MKTEKTNKERWANIGVFLAFTMLGSISFSFLSPIAPTNAADTMTTTTNAVVNKVISITSASDFALGPVTPTDAGAFKSVSGTVTVKTNSVDGYKLYIALNSSSQTDLTASGNTTSVGPCASSVTSSTMVKDTWGYSTDNTNFYPVTSSNAQIAAVSSPLTQLTNSHTVYIGAKLSTALQSGTYSNTVKFTATTN